MWTGAGGRLLNDMVRHSGVSASRFDDVCGSGGGLSDGVPNVLDIGCQIVKVKDLPSAQSRAQLRLKQQSPDPVAKLYNVIDIGQSFDAVKGCRIYEA